LKDYLILLIEDNPGDALLIKEELRDAPLFKFDHITRLSALTSYLTVKAPDVILLDLSLPDANGLETLQQALTLAPEIPIVVCTGFDDESIGAEAVHDGAQDYLVKGKITGGTLARSIRYAIERKKTERTINRLAYFDDLTQLPNRTLFLDRLRQCIAQSQRTGKILALLFLDLDHFKSVNDTFGHHVGDMLLQQFAKRLTDSVRAIDTVSRLGGDEFTILCPEISHVEDIAGIASKILKATEAPFNLEGKANHISTSIGISLCPFDAASPEKMLKHADAAMYRAKQRGRKRFQFYSSVAASTTAERLDLHHSLKEALDRKEFVLHYQPRLNLKTNQIAGVESLIRWQHPTRGLLSPLEFIPLAEETGLIVSIGEWVIEEALRQCNEWKREHQPDFTVSLNVSAQQFDQKWFLERVLSAAKRYSIDLSHVEFEITESQIISNEQDAVQAMRALRALGAQIALDDFGTGYSSLSYLKRYPLTTVKMDKSFFRRWPTSADELAIIRAVIDMAASLNLKVVAEGIESKEQIELLRQLNCDEVQGYAVSKPLTPSTLAYFLSRYSEDQSTSVAAPSIAGSSSHYASEK
jgi:diguanylate cyclase